jgi:enamine deaminase RidA (YjgF/YER057c/UK114 family)
MENKGIYPNPFPITDPDRYEIWEMLVRRDIEAYLAVNWALVADDFVEEGFMGINGQRLSNPDSWELGFPDLSSYRDEWLRQAKDTQSTEWGEDIEAAFHRITTLRDIEIKGDSALVHKKFDGSIRRGDGETDYLNWQTLYRCRKINGRWKIAGFTGYLPYPMGVASPPKRPAKQQPSGAAQHVTAGPYSPVLQVLPQQLVVISGQAAIDPAGNIIGETIEEQARFTLENCRQQLATGGASLQDVFKVNVYLTDLALWPRFNEVYKTFFTDPLPVRTAIGCNLLDGLIVEIEMWAVKKG